MMPSDRLARSRSTSCRPFLNFVKGQIIFLEKSVAWSLQLCINTCVLRKGLMNEEERLGWCTWWGLECVSIERAKWSGSNGGCQSCSKRWRGTWVILHWNFFYFVTIRTRGSAGLHGGKRPCSTPEGKAPRILILNDFSPLHFYTLQQCTTEGMFSFMVFGTFLCCWRLFIDFCFVFSGVDTFRCFVCGFSGSRWLWVLCLSFFLVFATVVLLAFDGF